MKSKEKRARRILRNALKGILELGLHVRLPSVGAVPPKEGQTLTRAEQVTFVPIPDELARRATDANVE